MCMVSAVVNEWMTKYPNPGIFPPIDYPAYIKAVEDAEAKDRADGQPDCSEGEKLHYRKELQGIIEMGKVYPK